MVSTPDSVDTAGLQRTGHQLLHILWPCSRIGTHDIGCGKFHIGHQRQLQIGIEDDPEDSNNDKSQNGSDLVLRQKDAIS